MQIAELKNEGLDFHVKVTIPSSKIDTKIQNELADLGRKVKIDGFRPGKIPLPILVKKYGASVKGDVIQKEINHSVGHVIKDHQLNVISGPKIEELKAEEGKNLEFILKFELMPNIEIPDLKKITIEKPVLKLSDKEIDKKLEELAQSLKTYDKEKKGKIEAGDLVTIDAVGYVGGKAFKEGEFKDKKLIIGNKYPVHELLKDLDEHLTGAKVGDELTVKATLPKTYEVKELAAKKAEFKIKITAVHAAHIPKVDDDFAKSLNFKSLEELRENMVKSLQSQAEDSIDTLMKLRLFSKLEPLLGFEPPKSLLDKEYQILKSQTEEYKKAGIDSENGEENFDQYYGKLATRRVKIGLMISEYAKLKKLSVEQQDFMNEITRQMKSYPGHEKEVFEYYQKNQGAVASLRGKILEQKAIRHIIDNELSLTTKEYSLDKLRDLVDKEGDKAIEL